MRTIAKSFVAVAVLAAAATFVFNSQAQQKPPVPATDTAALAEKVDIITKARTAVDLPLNEPRAIDLGLTSVPGIDRHLTEGVTAKAYTRYVDVDNKKIGQVVLVGVEKGGRQEALNSSDFTAQFDIAKPQIDPARDVLVKGDKAQLKAALERLAEKKEEKKEEAAEAPRPNQAQQSGGAAKQNELASGYQTPSAVNVAPAPEEQIRVTADGCAIRVDIPQRKAIQQTKAVTTKGGTVASESSCSDSSTAYPLEKSFSSCSDTVDMPTKTATAQFKWFYTDAGGSAVEVSNCTPDPDKQFQIVENFDACTYSLDFASQKATPRASLIYMDQNNREVQVRGCGAAESKPAVPLQKSYSVCTETIDVPNRKAIGQFRWFYISEGGGSVEVSDCAADPDRTFEIVEKFGSCTVSIDYVGKTATPRSLLVFTDQNSREVQVRGCDASDAKPAVPLIATTDSCTIRHDFPSAKSYQQGTYRYELDGDVFQAGGCTDNGTVYPHAKIYSDGGGNYVCNPHVDQAAKTVVLLSRLQITVNGLSQFITDCTPDTNSLAVQATTDGCTDPSTWIHDTAAARTYSLERFFYVDGGQRKYLTNCQASTTTYNHKVQVVGYQNHDGQKYAYAVSTLYITPPSGRYDIKVAEVLPGAVQLPYVGQGTDTRPSGESEYNGCNALRLTNKVELWKRPDNTVYEKPIGAGTPQGPVNVCTDTQSGTTTKATHNGYFQEPGEGIYLCKTRRTTFQIMQRKNSENGAVVSTFCGGALGSTESFGDPLGNCSGIGASNQWYGASYSCP